jgi:hypothetical protein
MAKINVQNTDITILTIENSDYISLTDMAHSQMEEHIIIKWLSLKSTIEYIGEWEILFNPNFNCTEFGTIRNSAGSNNFVLSVKNRIERTGAIGITAKQWREANPDLKGNMRDYATINELICLSNMENINAVLINDNVPQRDPQSGCHSANQGFAGQRKSEIFEINPKCPLAG